MFGAHGAPASAEEPAFSAAPPMGDARLPRPVPKRRWSIERLEALFSGRASSASEPKPTLVEKQKSLDPDSASSSPRRPMTRWSSAPAESNLWRHGRQFPNGLPMALAAAVSPEGQGCSFAIRSIGHYRGRSPFCQPAPPPPPSPPLPTPHPPKPPSPPEPPILTQELSCGGSPSWRGRGGENRPRGRSPRSYSRDDPRFGPVRASHIQPHPPAGALTVAVCASPNEGRPRHLDGSGGESGHAL